MLCTEVPDGPSQTVCVCEVGTRDLESERVWVPSVATQDCYYGRAVINMWQVEKAVSKHRISYPW